MATARKQAQDRGRWTEQAGRRAVHSSRLSVPGKCWGCYRGDAGMLRAVHAAVTNRRSPLWRCGGARALGCGWCAKPEHRDKAPSFPDLRAVLTVTQFPRSLLLRLCRGAESCPLAPRDGLARIPPAAVRRAPPAASQAYVLVSAGPSLLCEVCCFHCSPRPARDAIAIGCFSMPFPSPRRGTPPFALRIASEAHFEEHLHGDLSTNVLRKQATSCMADLDSQAR